MCPTNPDQLLKAMTNHLPKFAEIIDICDYFALNGSGSETSPMDKRPL